MAQKSNETGLELSRRRADLAPADGVAAERMEIATTRAAQEVQAAMVVAKKTPRDVFAAEKRILDACKRPALAQQAIYAYPRGGATVEGPSIRLAEVLVQNWGNIDTGIIELEQREGESTMMAYCWDLETNTRQTKVFSVKHERHTRLGVTKLVDPRDIYEMTANQGARRQRACILGIIPGDIVEAAVDACNKTMQGANTEPMSIRIKKMVLAFEPLSVTKEMIERRLGHRIDTLNETEYVGLRKIYKAIMDNMQTVDAFFGNDVPARGAVDVSEVIGRATETPNERGGTSETAPQPKAKAEEQPPDPNADKGPAPADAKKPDFAKTLDQRRAKYAEFINGFRLQAAFAARFPFELLRARHDELNEVKIWVAEQAQALRTETAQKIDALGLWALYKGAFTVAPEDADANTLLEIRRWLADMEAKAAANVTLAF